MTRVPAERQINSRCVALTFDNWRTLGCPDHGTRVVVETPRGDRILGEIVRGRHLHVRCEAAFEGTACTVRLPQLPKGLVDHGS